VEYTFSTSQPKIDEAKDKKIIARQNREDLLTERKIDKESGRIKKTKPLEKIINAKY
jgi:hypothetical protein